MLTNTKYDCIFDLSKQLQKFKTYFSIFVLCWQIVNLNLVLKHKASNFHNIWARFPVEPSKNSMVTNFNGHQVDSNLTWTHLSFCCLPYIAAPVLKISEAGFLASFRLSLVEVFLGPLVLAKHWRDLFLSSHPFHWRMNVSCDCQDPSSPIKKKN